MSPPCVLPCFCLGVVLGEVGWDVRRCVCSQTLSAYAFYRLEVPISIACHAFLLCCYCAVFVLCLSFVGTSGSRQSSTSAKPKNPSLHVTSLDFACLFLVLKAVFSRDPCIEGMSTNILKGRQKNPTNPIFQILGKKSKKCLYFYRCLFRKLS